MVIPETMSTVFGLPSVHSFVSIVSDITGALNSQQHTTVTTIPVGVRVQVMPLPNNTPFYIRKRVKASADTYGLKQSAASSAFTGVISRRAKITKCTSAYGPIPSMAKIKGV